MLKIRSPWALVTVTPRVRVSWRWRRHAHQPRHARLVHRHAALAQAARDEVGAIDQAVRRRARRRRTGRRICRRKRVPGGHSTGRASVRDGDELAAGVRANEAGPLVIVQAGYELTAGVDVGDDHGLPADDRRAACRPFSAGPVGDWTSTMPPWPVSSLAR